MATIQQQKIKGTTDAVVMGREQDHALDFLQTHKLDMKITPQGQGCPPGEASCRRGDHQHGLQYFVLLKPVNWPKTYIAADGFQRERLKHGMGFRYWPARSASPSMTSILRYLAVAASWPTDPDEVYDELGGEARPSLCIERANLSRRLKELLPAEAYKELSKFL